MDDLEFIRNCIQADKHAWDEFVQRYSRLIYSYIYSVLKEKGINLDTSLVDDLFQDVFLHLIKDDFKKLRQYQGKKNCSFAGWLRVVVINFVLDFLRKKQPRCVSLEEKLDTDTPALKDTLKDERFALSQDIILDEEELKNLSDCIHELDSEDKFFVEMHIYNGMSLENLRAILNISRSAIDMRKQRLIKKLKDCFQSKGFQLEN